MIALMGFILNLLLILLGVAGSVSALVFLVMKPKAAVFCLTTLVGGYALTTSAGDVASTLVGLAIGAVVGGALAGAIGGGQRLWKWASTPTPKDAHGVAPSAPTARLGRSFDFPLPMAGAGVCVLGLSFVPGLASIEPALVVGGAILLAVGLGAAFRNIEDHGRITVPPTKPTTPSDSEAGALTARAPHR